ncbi:HlyD family efflux transporter periplasmic adaptor subunit [Acidaminobacter sp. JC074]|uniref:efflux RND transporter periplasmic adaptor subunit n=1 Tax=Acidaminobacter sp. JC074 TaxID=2530199 RepID=UPI001F0DFD9B|nr:efflux RND transporter periplasmic adaptor subunit [Acidaminobacter sp. JC074]MCH4886934.1 HlyD family efflux transporter periplasmic adaptor subunit [Acidaminobacter sp. JC074]
MKKLALILIPILLVGGYFFLKGGSNAETAMVMPTTQIETTDIESKIYLNGSIKTEEVRNVKPASQERIESIFVNVGDVIKKGTVIAEMDSDTLIKNLKSKENQLEIENVKLQRMQKNGDVSLVNGLKSSKQSLNEAQTKMNNDKALLDAGVITKQTYDQSISAYESAKIAYENATFNLQNSSRDFDLFSQEKTIESLELEIENLKKSIEKNLIKAPIDGTVTSINSIVGEAVSNNLMIIENFDKNVIVANVSEADINKIEIGQAVTVTANSSKGKTYTGKVSFIAPGSKKIDGKKQAYVEIKVMLDEKAPELRPNFSVNMQLLVDSRSQVKSVKFEAIQTGPGGEEYLSVQNPDGTTKQVMILTGLSNDLYVEVISDEINVGDVIILNNSFGVVEEDMGIF